MRQAPPVILSIAGYDPSSGAGVTADVKTAAAHGCFAITSITAVTVQTTEGVRKVQPLDPELVSQTLFELAADMEIAAVRIGMLGSGAVAEEVATFLEAVRPPNVVLDPIFVSSSGARLFDVDPAELLKSDVLLDFRLLGMADVITPNAAEATYLSGHRVTSVESAREAARRLLEPGVRGRAPRHVVVTGGHLPENTDLLAWKDSDGAVREELFPGDRIESNATHGTGCAFATAIACNLALGKTVVEAVRAAKEYVRRAIAEAYPLGHGKGPMNHLFRL